MNGVQSGIRTLHLERCILRHKKNVRYVVAALLIKMPSLLGQVHGLAGRDILQVDNGVCDAAFGADRPALETDAVLSTGVTDLRRFGNWEIQLARHRASPFNHAGDESSVSARDHSIGPVSALSGG